MQESTIIPNYSAKWEQRKWGGTKYHLFWGHGFLRGTSCYEDISILKVDGVAVGYIRNNVDDSNKKRAVVDINNKTYVRYSSWKIG